MYDGLDDFFFNFGSTIFNSSFSMPGFLASAFDSEGVSAGDKFSKHAS